MPRKPSTQSTPISSIKHQDKRSNIPTEELRDFVVDDEQSPKTLLYPRDPSLDPQLVWKGKDEQDLRDLAVPSVPIYIQEKIHPQAIINDLLAQAARPGTGVAEEAANYQLNMFADFNGGSEDFDRKVEFYQHEQNWVNRMILGDSLLVMASLAEKEGLKGKVQTIYIDPPYGIKFGSNWQVSTRKRDVHDGKAVDATRQPEQVKAFRDTWKLGIHSYLAYLRDRLVAARELLTETGSVFVQIGDENVHLVRSVLDEVFGSENFCNIITFKKTGGLIQGFLPAVMDYLVWYAKDLKQARYKQLYFPKPFGAESDYQHVELSTGERRRLNAIEASDLTQIPQNSQVFQTTSLESENPTFEFFYNGYSYVQRWKTNKVGLEKLAQAQRLYEATNKLRYVRYVNDFPVMPLVNNWDDTGSSGYRDPNVYVVQTTTKVIERCMLMTTDPGDLVLDPTCGSGTTAYVAEQWGRRWITCDTSRVALALARTRLMSAKYPYYLLADSQEGIKKESELTGKMLPEYLTDSDIRKGFVYKRVPHVTLKSIANNPDIHEGMSREQIDAAIARHADTETLYDQPYADNKRVRVCGPFSVESLSPHRVLSTADENQDGVVTKQEASQQQDFATMILDNLKKAGVQNTRKSERLTFDRLDPYAGTWLHATGEYTDAAGKTRRVAVSIGPEHGTVGPQQVKEAAKEAVQGVGFDMLIVCGFAFDPHVAEEVKRYGKLTVLPAKIDEGAWSALYRTVSRPFARPASGKIAIKVINHYGDEVLKVFSV